MPPVEIQPYSSVGAASITNTIQIRGARTHNLRNIDLDIPHDQLVVITGRSGSGKSSLAFHTLFNEGQRQFFESQPFSARKFFRQLPEPDVDSISGLPPTLSLDQNPGSMNPRSTVGTVTEIYDYLRLLMARVGNVHCYKCDNAIDQQSPEDICKSVMRLPESTRMMLMSPIVHHKTGSHEAALNSIRRERLVRVRVDGVVQDIDHIKPLPESLPHSIDAVTDRIIIKPGIEDRLIKAIELSIKMSGGAVTVCWLTPDKSNAETKSDPSLWDEKLYSTRYACSTCDINYAEVEPRSFSFNSPLGACESCNGLGFAIHFDPAQVVPDRSKSLHDRAVSIWSDLTKAAYLKKVSQLGPLLEQLDGDVGMETSLDQLEPSQWETLLYNNDRNAPGLMVLLERDLSTSLDDDWCDRLLDMETRLECNQCGGSRLNPMSNAVRLGDANMAQIVSMSLSDALSFFENLNLADPEGPDGQLSQIAAPIVTAIVKRLSFLVEVGVGYLTLGRSTDTLSGGEYQRTRLGTSIGAGLTNVCYILDEPSIGLHQRDNQRLIDSIKRLREAGNSMVVIEHDESMMRAADHVIEIGPGAGRGGGNVSACGTIDQIEAATGSPTGQYLSGTKSIQTREKRRPVDDGRTIKIRGAAGFNLKELDADIPLNVLTCVTGVSGSGKSTLINQTLVPALKRHLELVSLPPAAHKSIDGLGQVDSLVFVDQKPVGRSAKSCPATYTGLFDEFRKMFAATRVARERGYTITRFSFNSKAGRCEHCLGHGHQKVRLDFLPDVFVKCDACQGRRFNALTLQAKFGEFSIADVLEMTVEQALLQFAGFSRIARVLQCLSDVGLGYVKLGQPANSLSGGESQRIKLAKELSVPREGHTMYVLDEPTTGLHFADIDELLTVLHRIVDQGNSMIVIEHNLDVVANADWVIDLGPEGGEGGGNLVAAGTPEDVAKVVGSLTGQFLN